MHAILCSVTILAKLDEAACRVAPDVGLSMHGAALHGAIAVCLLATNTLGSGKGASKGNAGSFSMN